MTDKDESIGELNGGGIWLYVLVAILFGVALDALLCYLSALVGEHGLNLLS